MLLFTKNPTQIASISNLESALTIHHLTTQKNTLDANYNKSPTFNEKYQLLVNLKRAQATASQNLKLKHVKEKQVHSEAMMKLELKNVELTKYEEKLTQEKQELKFQIADVLKGKEVHSEEKGQLEHQIAELVKGEEKHSADRG
ncbi:hypothetical protein D1007_52658 [Hordeum vulgare]|nr:hypothetical protein D1007_52658 [Hordeum vulgare]